jgi:hypothetical protein
LLQLVSIRAHIDRKPMHSTAPKGSIPGKGSFFHLGKIRGYVPGRRLQIIIDGEPLEAGVRNSRHYRQDRNHNQHLQEGNPGGHLSSDSFKRFPFHRSALFFVHIFFAFCPYGQQVSFQEVI